MSIRSYRFWSRCWVLWMVFAFVGSIQAQEQNHSGSFDAEAKELEWVPHNALGLVHVRLAELWKHPLMAESRQMLAKAGTKAMQALDEQFTPKPSSIDRVTLFAMEMEKSAPGVQFFVVLTFREDIDQEKVIRSYFANEKPEQVENQQIYFENDLGIAITFPNARTILAGSAKAVPAFLRMPRVKTGPLSPAIAAARSGKPMVAAMNLQDIPWPLEITDGMPEQAKPILRAKSMMMQMLLDQEMKLDLALACANADDAKSLAQALRDVADMARGALKGQPAMMANRLLYKPHPDKKMRPLEELPEALGGLMMMAAMNYVDEILAGLPLSTQGNSVSMQVTIPEFLRQYIANIIIGIGTTLPGVLSASATSDRLQVMNNMKQIGLAMHNYEAVHGTFPPAAICDKNGKPLLSWRVAILPYIEQDYLYQQFKLDEPWDSKHNLPLSKILVKVYSDPRMPTMDTGSMKTYMKVFVGKTAAFSTTKGVKLYGFTDGTSNTILVASGGEPVIWSKPDDFPFDPKGPLPDLKKPFKDLIICLADGSVLSIQPEKIKDFENVLKKYITRNGGEVAPWLPGLSR